MVFIITIITATVFLLFIFRFVFILHCCCVFTRIIYISSLLLRFHLVALRTLALTDDQDPGARERATGN